MDASYHSSDTVSATDCRINVEKEQDHEKEASIAVTLKCEAEAEAAEATDTNNNVLKPIAIGAHESTKLPPSEMRKAADGSKTTNLEVCWQNLSYVVRNKTSCAPSLLRVKGRRQEEMGLEKMHVILNSLSGSFRSGELTAIMGPSGCGKTTLLECISGKRHVGVTGDVAFNGCKAVKLSFIGQNDQLLCHMTVKESLLFASKIKNCKVSKTVESTWMNFDGLDLANGHKPSLRKPSLEEPFSHSDMVLNLLDQFGLSQCADVRVSCCSGGQLKRLSIAQELVSRPNLLILDEPTSGLDSASCFQCVELLQQVSRQQSLRHPMAIVVTIHQPSARVFNLFNRIYFLSTNGQCIYEGSPANLMGHLSSAGLQCPQFNNPADYMTEIASGDYGLECSAKLSTLMFDKRKAPAPALETTGKGQVSPNKRLKQTYSFPFFPHIWLIFKRTLQSMLRDPTLSSLRFFSHFFIALFIGLLYGDKIGKASGCPPADLAIGTLKSNQQELYDDIVATGENVANLFFATMFIMFGAMLPTVLTFPNELHVFLKERNNGWYSCRTYYLAKTLADIPLQIVFPALYGTIIYVMNGQVWSYWRFSMFILVLIMIGLVAQSQGLLVSAFFMNDPTSAVYVAPIISIPSLLFAGFFVRIKTMPAYLVPFSYVSYIRYSFEALVSLMYGFERCLAFPLQPTGAGNSSQDSVSNLLAVFFPEYEDDNSTDSDYLTPMNKVLLQNIVKSCQEQNPFMSDMFSSGGNATESYVMKQFELTDYSLYVNIARLVVFFLVLRVVAYFVLLWKTDQRK